MSVDHLVYATPDLTRGIDELHELLGVRATLGGQHPGLGTRNALIALGPDSYIEIVAPDPAQATPTTPRWFGIDELEHSRLTTWAAKATDLAALRMRAVQNGIPLGELATGKRRRPDGVELSWQLTDPRASVGDGVVPFFIDWGDSPHPAQTAAKGATFVGLRTEHPDASKVQRVLEQLDLSVAVRRGAKAALIATIDSPRGRIEVC